MTTEDFIGVLEQQKLISANMARQLRAKGQGDSRITPKAILKYLVKKEIVSRSAAKQVLETTLVVTDKAESSILGLAPLPEMPAERRPSPAPVAPPDAAKPPARPSRPKADETPKPPPGDDLFAAAASAGPAGRSADDDDAIVELREAAPLGGDETATAAATHGRKSKKKKRGSKSREDREKSEWDSPLILAGGAGLGILVIAGAVLYYLLIRENADAVLKEGNELFETGSYTQSIGKYEHFVKNWPSHEEISQARVRLGMARLWQATQNTGDYAGALTTAQQVISDIEDEPAFAADEGDEEGLSQAKRELSSLLTTIAKGLADQADAATDEQVVQQRVEQINTVLGLTANTKYVPQRFRMDSELDAVRDTLERVQLRQQRGVDLAAALAAMDDAIAKGDTAAAFAARSAVIKQYPVLVDDAALGEKVLKIAEAERALVKFVESRQAAATAPAETPIVAELALAERRGSAAAEAGTVVVQVDGALLGLNAADGALLWRRFVGLAFDAVPLPLANGNVAVVDSQRGELACLNQSTGNLVWRLPLEGKLASPVAANERLLVASEAGRLYVVDQQTGELSGYVEFKQPLRLPPTVNDNGDRVFVLGEHSNLYTLASSDLACLGVHYLGHAAGGVATPPIAVLNKVVVADNSGAETCQIRVFALNEQGAVDKEVAGHRMSGLVLTPLQTAGRRFAAVTSRGQAVVFEAGAANDATALTAVASREAQDREPIARFSLLHDGHLWIAGRQLTKLAILPTGNQLPVRSLDRNYQGDAFDYPLQSRGSEIVHLRRPSGRPGAIVAAMDAASSKALWETEVVVPPAGAPAVDASGLRITAGAASGAVYDIDRDAMARRVQDKAVRLDLPPTETLRLSESLDLTRGRILLGGVGSPRLVHYRPDDPREPLRAVELPGPLSCSAVAWGNGFVAATDVGQVFLYDAETLAPLGAPFQPELAPGQQYRWLRPAVVGDGEASRLLVSDGKAKVYLLALQAQPQPHLAAEAAADVGASPLETPLAAAASRVYAGNEAGQLASFALPDLAPGDPVELGGRVVWGPFAVGEALLLATDAKELILVGGDGAIRWRQPLKRGDVGGQPLADGETALVLYPAVGLARIALGDGAEAAFVELGQPAIKGPVPFGPRLIVSAPDGSLLVLNRP